MKYAVAIDIGGTNTRVALVNEKLEITDRQQFSTNPENPEETLGKIAEVIKGYNHEIVGVGMSCPGPLDLVNARIITPPNLRGLAPSGSCRETAEHDSYSGVFK